MSRIEGRVVYFNGNACQLTGHAEIVYGGLFYDAIALEGMRKGETVVIAAKHVVATQGGQS